MITLDTEKKIEELEEKLLDLEDAIKMLTENVDIYPRDNHITVVFGSDVFEVSVHSNQLKFDELQKKSIELISTFQKKPVIDKGNNHYG